jgi:hypothetical protein
MTAEITIGIHSLKETIGLTEETSVKTFRSTLRIKTNEKVEFEDGGNDVTFDFSRRTGVNVIDLEQNNALVQQVNNLTNPNSYLLQEEAVEYYSNLNRIVYVNNIGWFLPTTTKYGEDPQYIPTTKDGVVYAIKLRSLARQQKEASTDLQKVS